MKARHFAQLVLMSALWGASFPMLRHAAPAFGPIGVTGIRVALASLVLALLMRLLRERWPARQAWLPLGALGLMTVGLPFVLFSWAALSLPAGYSAVFNATAPMFGVLAGALLGEERVSPARLLGCLLGFVGVMCLVQLGPVAVTPRVLLAALACVLAAGCYGIGAIWMRRATLAHGALPSSAMVHVACALVFVLPVGLSAPTMQPTPGAWLSIAVLGLFTSGFMYWISMRLLREISAVANTSSSFMIPMFGVTWGWLFLDETVTLGMLPGCVLVLAAMLLVTGYRPWRTGGAVPAAPPAISADRTTPARTDP